MAGDGELPVIDYRTKAGATAEWFTLPRGQAGIIGVQTAKLIEESLKPRQQEMLNQARAWSNSWLGCLADLGAARRQRQGAPWNVLQSGVGTAKSMICRSPVSVSIEAEGENRKLSRLARDATRWAHGVFAANQVHQRIAPTLQEDGAVVDTGHGVFRVGDGKVVIDRVLADQVIISEAEAIAGGGEPYQGFVKWYLPKHFALKKWGDDSKEGKRRRDAIMATPIEQPGVSAGLSWTAQLIPVYEGWAVNGAHFMAVPAAELEYEEWPYPKVPIVPMYYEQPAAGWWGRGICRQLLNYQIEIWEISDAIRAHIRLFSALKWVIDSGSGIDADDLDNEIGGILVKAKGSDMPQPLVLPPIPPELFQERREIYSQALNELGMNEWSVAGQEPADRSGKAMEIARDKERGRILTPGQNYEDWHKRAAEMALMLGDKTSGNPVAGKGPEDKDMRPVDFKAVAKFMKDSPWQCRVWPASIVPEEPQAKRDTIERWQKQGLITGPTAVNLMGIPGDVDEEASLMSAAREEVQWQIEGLLDGGSLDEFGPEPAQDLETGLRYMAAARSRARRQKVSEAILDRMERWRVMALALLEQAAPPKPAPEMRPGVGEAPAVVAPVEPAAAAAPAAPVVDPSLGSVEQQLPPASDVPVDPALAEVPPV